MFRDVHLITEDYSVRIQIGWIIFRWWRPYVYKDLSEGQCSAILFVIYVSVNIFFSVGVSTG